VRRVRSIGHRALDEVVRLPADGAQHVEQLAALRDVERAADVVAEDPKSEVFDFRGGCTLIFDLEGDEPSLRYAITKPIDDEARLAEIRKYRTAKAEERFSLRETYFGPSSQQSKEARNAEEVFCILHT